MADYWKSQPRKYCEFCKCWIADNRPSIDFHERGRRHKNNVEKKINFALKKSVQERRAQINFDRDIRKMEQAARLAYSNDLVNNPDYSATSRSASALVEETVNESESVPEVKKPKKKHWHEVKSGEHVYYWNVKTGATQWEPPKEGFVTVEEQLAEPTTSKAEPVHKPPPVRVTNIPTIGPAQKPDPYGGWTSVDNSETEIVDLQLPKVEPVEEYTVIAPAAESRTKFAEKVLKPNTLGSKSSETVTFKKRKLAGNATRNVRQRGGDE